MIPFYKFGILSWLSWSFFDFLPKSGLMEILPKQLDQVVIIATKPVIFHGIEEIKNFEQFLILLVFFIPYCYLHFSSVGFFLWLTWEVIKDMCSILFDGNRRKGNYLIDFCCYIIILYFDLLLIGYMMVYMLPIETFFSLWFYWFTYPQFLLFVKVLGLIILVGIILYISFISTRIRK
jgi:hypothetical protein